VSRVQVLRRFDHIEAEMDLPSDDPLFANHFPSNPMLPASLLVEAFAQAASILLETSSGFTRKAIPGFLVNAKFRRPVRPPALVTIRLDVTQNSEDGAVLSGRATQRGTVAGTCNLGMILAPLVDFYAPEHAETFRRVYAGLLEEARLEGFDHSPLESLRDAIAR
jgi:3-hydroxyacyl-[acyl-carrier-protein] dehydratase